MDALCRTLRGAAEALQVSPRHVERLIAAGTLREVVIPSPTGAGRPLRRVREDDLQALIDQFTKGPAS